MKIDAIDMFCGIGGLTHGLKKAGINVVAGLDNDNYCSYTYEKNNNSRFILADISNYDFKNIKSFFSKKSYKVLVGCAPCQPFSSHTYKSKKKDDRWNLVNYFVEAIKALKPDVISMENVRGIIKTNIFKNFIEEILKLEYNIDYKIVYCPDYGIPQARSRLVLLASKLGKIYVPKGEYNKKNYVTVFDTISKLSSIKAGEKCFMDEMHITRNLSALNIKRLQQSNPKGTWKDWDKKLLPNCYKRKSGQTYTSVYGRMAWDCVSPTITTQFTNYGSGRFGHPKQDRALSIREGALLQTFPIDYIFSKEIGITKLAKHIGNAVPPKLAYVIGKAIKQHIKQQDRLKKK